MKNSNEELDDDAFSCVSCDLNDTSCYSLKDVEETYKNDTEQIFSFLFDGSFNNMIFNNP